MKTINREELRGKPLAPMCKRARTTRHEFGPHDNRVFCYGLYALGPEDGQLHGSCLDCKALVDNAEPVEEDEA